MKDAPDYIPGSHEAKLGDSELQRNRGDFKQLYQI
jgi:hypothetical protein